MRCTAKGCRRFYKRGNGRGGVVWAEEDTEAMRRNGWFVWDQRAPVEYHGLTLCPQHRDPAGLEAKASAPLAAEERIT